MSTAISVVHVIDSLGRGGAEQALLNIASELSNHDIELVIIPLFKNTTLQQSFIDRDIEVVNLPFSNKWRLLKNVRLLSNFLRSRNIQVAHAHLIFSGIYVGLTKLFRLKCIRVISFHNLAYAKGCNPKNVSYFFRKTLNWLVLKFCYDKVLAVSTAVSKHYSHHFGLSENEIIILANGLPVKSYERYCHNDAKAAEKGKPLRILALGRLVKEKGYDFLLPAFALLQEKVATEVELYIVGGGPLETSLIDLSDHLGISSFVSFKGSISHDAAMQELAKADVYVLPSIFEGFGLSLVEAVLLDVPVVATKVGGVLDIVDAETAVLVNSGNSKALAEGLAAMLSKSIEDRQIMARAAKKSVIERYSASEISGQLSNLYRLLLLRNE